MVRGLDAASGAEGLATLLGSRGRVDSLFRPLEVFAVVVGGEDLGAGGDDISYVPLWVAGREGWTVYKPCS